MSDLYICSIIGAFIDPVAGCVVARPAGVPEAAAARGGQLSADACAQQADAAVAVWTADSDGAGHARELRCVTSYLRKIKAYDVHGALAGLEARRREQPVQEAQVRAWLQYTHAARGAVLAALPCLPVRAAQSCIMCDVVFATGTTRCPECQLDAVRAVPCSAQSLFEDTRRRLYFRVHGADTARQPQFCAVAARVFDFAPADDGEDSLLFTASMGLLNSGVLAAVPEDVEAREFVRACSMLKGAVEEGAAVHRGPALRVAVQHLMVEAEGAIGQLSAQQRLQLCAATEQTGPQRPRLKPLTSARSTIDKYSLHVAQLFARVLAFLDGFSRVSAAFAPGVSAALNLRPGAGSGDGGSVAEAGRALEAALLAREHAAAGVAARDAELAVRARLFEFSQRLLLFDFAGAGFDGVQSEKPIVLALALLVLNGAGWNLRGVPPPHPVGGVQRELVAIKRFALQVGCLAMLRDNVDAALLASGVFAPADAGHDSAYLDLLDVLRTLRGAAAVVDNVLSRDRNDPDQLVYLGRFRVSLRSTVRFAFEALTEAYLGTSALLAMADTDIMTVNLHQINDGLSLRAPGYCFLSDGSNADALDTLRAVTAKLALVLHADATGAARRRLVRGLADLARPLLLLLHIFGMAPRSSELRLRICNGPNGEPRGLFVWGGLLCIVLHNRKSSAQRYADDATVLPLPWIVSMLLVNYLVPRCALATADSMAGAASGDAQRWLLLGHNGQPLTDRRVADLLRDEWRTRAGFPFNPKDLRRALCVFQSLHGNALGAEEQQRGALAMQRVNDLVAGHHAATVEANYGVLASTPLRSMLNFEGAANAHWQLMLSAVGDGAAALGCAFRSTRYVTVDVQELRDYKFIAAALVRIGSFVERAKLLLQTLQPAAVKAERAPAGALAAMMERHRLEADSAELPAERARLDQLRRNDCFRERTAVEEPELLLRDVYPGGYKSEGQRALVETAAQLLHADGGTLFAIYPTACGKTAAISVLARLRRNRGRVIAVITTLLSQLVSIEGQLRVLSGPAAVHVTRYSKARSATGEVLGLRDGVLTLQYEDVGDAAEHYLHQLADAGVLAAVVVDEAHIIEAHAAFRSSGARVLELVRALRMRVDRPVPALLMTATITADDLASILRRVGPGFVQVIGKDYRESRAITVSVRAKLPAGEALHDALLSLVGALPPRANAMVFVEDKAAVLLLRGLVDARPGAADAGTIVGGDDEHARGVVLQRLADPKDPLRVLVATSAAAAGVNVPRTELVCIVVNRITTLYAVHQMLGRGARELGEAARGVIFVEEPPADALLQQYLRIHGTSEDRERYAAHVLTGGSSSSSSNSFSEGSSPAPVLWQSRSRLSPTSAASSSPTSSQESLSPAPRRPPQLFRSSTPPPPSATTESPPSTTRKRRAVSEPLLDAPDDDTAIAAPALVHQAEFRAQQQARQDGEQEHAAVASRVGAFLLALDEAAAGSTSGVCARCLFHGRPLADVLHQSFARKCPYVREPNGAAVQHKLRGTCAFPVERQSRCCADTEDCAVYSACNFYSWQRRDWNACNVCWGRKDVLAATHADNKCQSPTRFIVPTVALMAFKTLRRQVANALPDARDSIQSQDNFLQWAREIYKGPITNGHRLLEWTSIGRHHGN